MDLKELFLEEVISSNSVIGYHATDTPNMDEVLAERNYKIGSRGGTGGGGPGFYATLYDRDVNTLYGKYVYKCRIPIDNFLIFDEKTFNNLKPSYFKKSIISIKEKYELSFYGAQLIFFGMKKEEAKKMDEEFKVKVSKSRGLSGGIFDELRKNTWFNRARGTKIKGVIFSGAKGITIISFFPQSIVVLGKANEIKSRNYNNFDEFKKINKEIVLKQNRAKQTSFGDIKVDKDDSYELHKEMLKEKKAKKRRDWD
jgi:hypothetical protein